MEPSTWLRLCRTVRFGDTDAAGVMHFQQLLRWCHEAYEESLERFGLTATTIFPAPGATPDVALPIVHCQADYLAPLVVGDPLAIQLEPRRLDPGCFELHYRFQRSVGSDPKPVAQALTRHLALQASSRQRCALPLAINRWLEASSLGSSIQPL
ncbi:MAG: acyl-CoA thioesterase [Cyanobacteriota bacterium]|nr:acyl-CoA thioesterase [Cyanobacteriota bacterium]